MLLINNKIEKLSITCLLTLKENYLSVLTFFPRLYLLLSVSSPILEDYYMGILLYS